MFVAFQFMCSFVATPTHIFYALSRFRVKQTTQFFITLQVCIMYMQYAIVYIFVLPFYAFVFNHMFHNRFAFVHMRFAHVIHAICDLCKCFTNSEFVKMV